MIFLEPVWLEKADSTNLHLCHMVRSGLELSSGTVIAAHEQSCGRGRLNRVWHSTAGDSLTFSFYLSLSLPLHRYPSLPMACAIGVAEFLSSLGIQSVVVKWPNDVLISRKKICGILTEIPSGGRPTGQTSIVVGIGLNVNLTSKDLEQIDKPATSIFAETGTGRSPEAILPLLLSFLEPWITLWCEAGFAALRSRWLELSSLEGMDIRIEESPGKMERVTVLGYGDMGELLVRQKNGISKAVWAAEIHRG